MHDVRHDATTHNKSLVAVLGTVAIAACGQTAHTGLEGQGATSALPACSASSVEVRNSQPGPRPALAINRTTATGRVPTSTGYYDFTDKTLSQADAVQLDRLVCAAVAQHPSPTSIIGKRASPATVGGQVFVSAVTSRGKLSLSFTEHAAKSDVLVSWLRDVSMRYFGSTF